MVALNSRRAWSALAVTLVLVGGLSAAMSLVKASDNDGDGALSEDTVDNEDLQPVPPVANTANAAFFLRIGLGADVLAAAGVRSSQVPALAAAVFDAVSDSGTTLEALDAAYVSARGNVDPLRRKVRSGQGSAEDVRTLAANKVTCEEAETSREVYIENLRAAALLTLPAGTRSKLAKIWENRLWRSVPMEFRVADMTQAEWVQLRDDLGAERIAAKNGEPCPPEAAAHLASCRAVSAIATAKVELDTYHASVQAAWNTAVE